LDGIIHGCYRGSRLGSAIVTAAYGYHRLLHTWNRVDLFIAVSEFEREILVKGSLPADKVVVKPNFVGLDKWKADRNSEDVALYVGRLSPEKGIGTLLSAWNTGKISTHLKIIGDGPMADQVRSSASKNANVEYLGKRPQETVYSEMTKARFLVFPSECYETFGRTIVEAFSVGTPVLACDLGGVRELVNEGITGYCYAPANVDALIDATRKYPLGEAYERMRMNCRNMYLSKFTADANYNQLMDIYRSAIAHRKMRH
jgi:glycosyltransferase involved in cell wall biosynthesis